MMAKIQRVKKVQLWSFSKILAVATLAAVLSVSFLFGVSLILEALRAVGWDFGPDSGVFYVLPILTTIVLFGLPAMVAIRYHPRFRRWLHGFFFGAVYSLAGFATGAFVTEAINYLRFGGPTGFTLVRIDIVLTRALGFSIVSGCLFVLLWIASRKSRGQLKIVHGTQCPTCEYNLVGNTTYICPECGHPFTLEELDVSADDLKPG